MTKIVISTQNAPAPVGAYNQAIVTGNLIFVSGQIPLDPDTGELIDGDFKARCNRVLENLKAIVESAGSSIDKIVKTNVYLTDLSNFSEVNETYAEFFKYDPPARAAVEVSKLPLGVDIEIECIAEL
ncbi:MAG: RidA family protein [Candidatus Marinimicrobia bacterium]|nr:RidA family protein [Candidatus Neomarinimicrobiota bacterium]